MKAHLAKVSLALLSTVFLFGCQERGSEPVGPEGLGPEFAKVKNCGPTQGKVHPSCNPPEEDGQTVTVTLAGGMTGTLTEVKVFSDNDKKFAMNTGAQSTGMITMNFQSFDEGECLVEDPRGDAPAVARLKRQLNEAVIDVADPLFSLFNVKVDRTTLGLPDEKGNDLQVTYDPNDRFGGVILGWAHRDRVTVKVTR